jgi:hypothetical protein
MGKHFFLPEIVFRAHYAKNIPIYSLFKHLFSLMAIRQIYQTAPSMKFEYDNGEFTTR